MQQSPTRIITMTRIHTALHWLLGKSGPPGDPLAEALNRFRDPDADTLELTRRLVAALRPQNRGDHAAAARAFGLWNKARVNGKLTELRGLTSRRAAEAALYLRPSDGKPAPMPQAVAPESRIAASPIATVIAAKIGSTPSGPR
jgi:hypothetical protein